MSNPAPRLPEALHELLDRLSAVPDLDPAMSALVDQAVAALPPPHTAMTDLGSSSGIRVSFFTARR